MDDDRLASITAARLGVRSVTDTYGADWYGQGDEWAGELPDLSQSKD